MVPEVMKWSLAGAVVHHKSLLLELVKEKEVDELLFSLV